MWFWLRLGVRMCRFIMRHLGLGAVLGLVMCLKVWIWLIVRLGLGAILGAVLGAVFGAVLGLVMRLGVWMQLIVMLGLGLSRNRLSLDWAECLLPFMDFVRHEEVEVFRIAVLFTVITSILDNEVVVFRSAVFFSRLMMITVMTSILDEEIVISRSAVFFNRLLTEFSSGNLDLGNFCHFYNQRHFDFHLFILHIYSRYSFRCANPFVLNDRHVISMGTYLLPNPVNFYSPHSCNLLDDGHFHQLFNVHRDDSALHNLGGAILMIQLLHEECLLIFSHLRNTLDNPHLGHIILTLHQNIDQHRPISLFLILY
ncbi:hypothetical protein M758_4G189900 [Ceratodon purpureus]|uniref:Uncharacterized protein n=1 Tax=Ceratodon purpureus TaxID=3225 RepID=A0A8T0IB17_CERPU|nr:hypothetical protein KC19_4G186700 [Ceratodon purpureus]KAG0620108.1 hypothetical protein M758_4G189900 [Ceratodon purpureus]